MALTKPPVLPVWADSGDKVQPSNAELQVGWPLSAIPPARQRFNWIINFLANGVRYLTRRGLADWDATETYEIGDYVRGADGLSYRAVTSSINMTPASNPSNWTRWGFALTELGTELNKLDAKTSCRAASTANIATLSGLSAIDGVTPVSGDRLLVKNQTTGSQNGIYVAAAGAWTRATDAADGTVLTPGANVMVEEGTQADTLWLLTNDGTITVGTTALVFVSIAGSAGYAKTNAVNTFTKGQIGNVTALPALTGTVTLDLSQSNNWYGTLTGNITLANPTNLVAGQSGIIAITNGATPYTIAYGSYFKGLSGVLPALTADANAKDSLAYYVDSATHITITSLGDIR